MFYLQKLRAAALSVITILILTGSAVLPFSVTKTASAAPTANLIAHWRFSEGSLSFITDSSGNGYHGTAVNTNWTSAADASPLDPYALYFNGSSSYVDTADFDINDDFTISAWIKVDDEEEDGSVVAKHTSNGGNLVVFGIWNDRYHFRIRDKTFDGPYVQKGDWVHIAVTAYKEVAGPTSIERVSLYVNGEYIDQYSLLTEVGDVSGGKPWTIGQDWDSGPTRTDFFDGAIDDVRIYDGELLPSEIKALSEDHTAICHIYPSQEPDLNFAGGSGVCDEVMLTTGTYTAGNILPINDILIRGSHPADTIINITDTGSKRFISNSLQAVTLQNMTIRNGNILSDGLGGGIYNTATMTLTHMVLTNNTSDGDGGALYNSGHITLDDVEIHGNSGDNGGGFTNAGSGHASLNNVHIWDNTSNGGGGILNTSVLTITESLIENNSTNNSGGGILNYGVLWLSNTEISNNTAVGNGGGLYNDDFSSFVGTATINSSQFLSNNANNSGGGITNAGTLTLNQSTVSGNSAQNSGGGISNSQLANQIDIKQSTISNNQAGGIGAGLENGSDAIIKNSTISGNQRTNPSSGAGIYSSGNLELTHVTLSNNSSTGSGTVNGLYLFGTADIYNILLVDNGAGSQNCDLAGATVTQVGNLSDDDSCTGFNVDAATAVMPLADNGGPTWTHALPANSPAFETANAAYCLMYDQRNIPRGSVCDVGAYEYGEASLIFLPLLTR